MVFAHIVILCSVFRPLLSLLSMSGSTSFSNSRRYRTRQRRERNGPDEKAVHQKKGYNVVERKECHWWNLYTTTTCVKEYLREPSPYKHPL